MNTKDFINIYANKMDITKVEATKYVATMLDTVKELITDGDEIAFHRFGVFGHKCKEKHTARNPRTNKLIEIEAKTVPTFHFSPVFQNEVRGD